MSGLEGPGHTQPGHLVGPHALDLPTFEQNASRGWSHGTCDQVEESRLACAVRPDDGTDLPGRESGGNMVDGRQAAILLGQTPGFKHGSWPPPRRCWQARAT